MVRTKIIAEIGINYAFGNDISKFIDNAKKLIDVACVSGCDYVKFQKRNPDVCVPDSQKSKPKIVPWRKEEITYLQYKKDIEFGKDEFDEINEYCKHKKIKWFASVWDKESVDFMSRYCDIMKIPSALITNLELCKYARYKSKYLIISTGMSTESEIKTCEVHCSPDLIMHTNSSYPSNVDELRLEYIKWLISRYQGREIGYSGHEFGLTPTMTAVTLGATWVERHITLDRTLWGSDQIASVEPHGLIKLVKGIRDIELSMGGYEERQVFGSELEKRKSLRGE
jgi:N-acetylneuraminate synthase